MQNFFGIGRAWSGGLHCVSQCNACFLLALHKGSLKQSTSQMLAQTSIFAARADHP